MKDGKGKEYRMSIHLAKEISSLKKMILQLCAVVEENVRQAVDCVVRRDIEEARRVIDSDHEVDSSEIEIEEECLKILALHQPVATDLRYVISCLKLNNDLERIGDLAVNIAKRAIVVSGYRDDPMPFDFSEIMDKTRAILKKSLDSLIDMNPDLAREVLAADDEIDRHNKNIHIKTNNLIRKEPDKAEYYIQLLIVSRHLERIADYATNIAEDVIYMSKGEIVRHHRSTFNFNQR